MRKWKNIENSRIYHCYKCKVSWSTSNYWDCCPFCSGTNISRVGVKYRRNVILVDGECDDL